MAVIDLEAALARLGGDMAFYQQLYPMFRKDAAALVAQLATLLADGRRDDARQVLHTVKGLAGTVGATALAAAAQEAELAMAHDASGEDARLMQEVTEAFWQACNSVEDAVPALRPTPGQ